MRCNSSARSARAERQEIVYSLMKIKVPRNFCSLDAPFNLQYYDPDRPESQCATMGCYDSEAIITVLRNNDVVHLRIGDFVRYPDALSCQVWDTLSGRFVRVKNVIINPETADWLRLTFSDGRFTDVTSDHRFTVLGHGIKTASEMCVGDVIPNGKPPICTKSAFTIPYADEIELYWLLGVIIRDGNLSGGRITVSVGPDEKDLAGSICAVWEMRGVRAIVTEQQRGYKGHYFDIATQNSVTTVSQIADLFGGYQKIYRRIPYLVMAAPREYQLAFLGGMIDADGHVHDRNGVRRIQLGTINKGLSVQTFMLAQSLGFKAKIYAAPYGRGAEFIRYSVEIEPTEELISYVLCAKKKTALLTASSFSHIQVRDTLRLMKIERLNKIEQSYCLETETDRFDANGIVAHNCRTRVLSNTYDPKHAQVTGRGNLFFTTVNLPYVALLVKESLSAGEDLVTSFIKKLDEVIDDVIDFSKDRFEIVAKRKAKNYPFMMGQHIYLGSETLGPEDEIREVIKQGSITMGFIGLAETLITLCGKHHGESEEAQKLGLKIIGHMRERMDQISEETHMNWTLMGTPAEGCCGRLLRLTRKRFGVIPGVTDHAFLTNSSHLPVYFPVSAYDKIRIEAPYHALENAGHILYVELDNDTSKNLEAFEQLVTFMAESDAGYFSINHPVDHDPVCGYTGVIGDVCPRCGRHENEGVPAGKLLELGAYTPDPVYAIRPHMLQDEADEVIPNTLELS